MDGRREVFVPSPDLGQPQNEPLKSDTPGTDPTPVSDPQPATFEAPANASTFPDDPSEESPEPREAKQTVKHEVQAKQVSLDFETALAMADSKAELAVNAYQSLTQSIERQAQVARKMARVAWCMVGVLTIGMTVALVWTATRVTKAESDSQHTKQQADLDAQRFKEMAEDADKRADKRDMELADIQQKLSEAQQHAARAEGRAAVYEEMQPKQATSRPTSRPNLIDRLTTAFGSGQ